MGHSENRQGRLFDPLAWTRTMPGVAAKFKVQIL
jgi:hypothetical protein